MNQLVPGGSRTLAYLILSPFMGWGGLHNLMGLQGKDNII